MRGNALPLGGFIEGSTKQFIIPVYQRKYDWKIDNCEQLFNDLVKLSHSDDNRKTHFSVPLSRLRLTTMVIIVWLLMDNSD